jgi:glycerol-3-phosphate acyltransferase PlsX
MNAESIGGLQVMGVNAPVMIGHGSSSARAICSMILSMERDIKSNFPAKLREALKESAATEAEA